MGFLRLGAALCAVLLLSGCAGRFTVDYPQPLDRAVSRDWRVTGVRTVVPEKLTVSEDNVFAPNADIVWHGEPSGDRKAQVAAILTEGVGNGAAPLRGKRKVVLYVEVSRFHGVTPISLNRAPSAVHDIAYRIWVLDQRSGRTIVGPVRIDADLLAYTQTTAVLSHLDGRSERARIVEHVASVTAGWLGIGPDVRENFVSLGR
jgi:hypothetical protein